MFYWFFNGSLTDCVTSNSIKNKFGNVRYSKLENELFNKCVGMRNISKRVKRWLFNNKLTILLIPPGHFRSVQGVKQIVL